jgi:hypothetical protein
MIDRRDFIKASLMTASGIVGLPLTACGGGDSSVDTEITDPGTLVTAGTPTVTSTTPRLFNDFTTSDAYKEVDYKEFTNSLKLEESVVIPGLKMTASIDGSSTKMTPQGVCFAGEYILISAYDNGKPALNSVIYVISNNSPTDRRLLTVISLPTTGHVGGLAFDGDNVWVCDSFNKMGAMSVIKYTELVALANSGSLISKLTVFATTCPVLTSAASFASFYDDKLFVGKFNETDVDDMYGYEIKLQSTAKPELQKVIKMEVPVKTQGVAFRSDGLMIASTSFGRANDAELRFYQPDWSHPNTSNFIFKRDAVHVLTIPPMSEGIVFVGDYAYVLFESTSGFYYGAGVVDSKNPVDRVLAFNTRAIVG